MTPNEGTDINVGAALRDGLRLNTVEVVALLHNACLQVDAGTAAALPTSVDNLWVTDAGTVALPPIAPVEPARATVGLLLETLLPAANDTGGDSVPAALRSLPARLRQSASTSDASELKDLLTILRWHLPYESSEVLRDFVARARLATVEPAPAAAIDLFADEGAAPLPAAPVVEPEIVPTSAAEHTPTTAPVTAPTTASETPPAIAPATTPTMAPVTPRAFVPVTPPAIVAVTPPAIVPATKLASVPATTPANELVLERVAPVTHSPRSRSGSPRRLAIAAAVLLAVGAAGFGGYQFSQADPDVATATPADITAPIAPLPGRITRASDSAARFERAAA